MSQPRSQGKPSFTVNSRLYRLSIGARKSRDDGTLNAARSCADDNGAGGAGECTGDPPNFQSLRKSQRVIDKQRCAASEHDTSLVKFACSSAS